MTSFMTSGTSAERREAAMTLIQMLEGNDELALLLDEMGGTIPLQRERSFLKT